MIYRIRVWLSQRFLHLAYDVLPEGKIKEDLGVGLTVSANLMLGEFEEERGEDHVIH